MTFKELDNILSLHPYWNNLSKTSKIQIVNTCINNVWDNVLNYPVNSTTSVNHNYNELASWYLIDETKSNVKVKDLNLDVPNNLLLYIINKSIKKLTNLIKYSFVIGKKKQLQKVSARDEIWNTIKYKIKKPKQVTLTLTLLNNYITKIKEIIVGRKSLASILNTINYIKSIDWTGSSTNIALVTTNKNYKINKALLQRNEGMLQTLISHTIIYNSIINEISFSDITNEISFYITKE